MYIPILWGNTDLGQNDDDQVARNTNRIIEISRILNTI